jgi:hypothetical protein
MIYFKVAAGLFIAGLLAWAGKTLYDAGYNSAQAELLKARADREVQISARFVRAVNASEAKRAEAISELNELRRRPPVVITDVQTKIIERNVCRSFDREFMRLLDDT